MIGHTHSLTQRVTNGTNLFLIILWLQTTHTALQYTADRCPGKMSQELTLTETEEAACEPSNPKI